MAAVVVGANHHNGMEKIANDVPMMGPRVTRGAETNLPANIVITAVKENVVIVLTGIEMTTPIVERSTNAVGKMMIIMRNRIRNQSTGTTNMKRRRIGMVYLPSESHLLRIHPH
jgi:hypothetical protein